MRKLTMLVTLILLSLFIIQCGGQASAPAAPAPAAPTTAPAAQKPAEAPKAAAPTEAPKAAAPTQAPAPKQEAPKATEAPKAAAPAAPAAAGKNLRFVWLGDLNPLWHPAGYETFGQAVVFSLIFNNLVKLDEDLKTIIPDLAEKWEVTPDATSFTFTLRKNVKWHDGRPFTAKDVVFTFSRQIVEPFRFTKFMEAIKGAKDYKEGKATSVAGLTAPDDFTVKIVLDIPDSVFLLNLTEPSTVIVPEHLLKDVKPETIEQAQFVTKTPVGTGPYKFVQYVTDQVVELDVNPDYFKGKPKIDKVFMKRLRPEVTVAQLESGEVDLALRLNPVEYERLVKVPTLNVISRGGVGSTGFQFPIEQARVADKRVRQALYYGIDRKAIVDAVFQGRAQVAKGGPPALDGFAGLDPYNYNPDKAKQLLQAANFDTKAPFRIIYDQGYPAAPQYYPIIQQQLQKIGINVELTALDATAYIDRLEKKRDTYEAAGFHGGAWGLGPQVTATYYNCKRPGWGTSYSNCALDDLFAKFKATSDLKVRDTVAADIAKLLNDEVPRVHLWTPNDLHASVKKLGGGFSLYGDPRRSFTKVETWTME